MGRKVGVIPVAQFDKNISDLRIIEVKRKSKWTKVRLMEIRASELVRYKEDGKVHTYIALEDPYINENGIATVLVDDVKPKGKKHEASKKNRLFSKKWCNAVH